MKLNIKEIQHINLFEKVTRAKVKDCIFDDEITFIIEEGNVQRALGENNSNIRKISAMLKKPVKIIAFSETPEKFINNLIYPIRTKIELKDNKIYITEKDVKLRGKIYGREKENLKKIKTLANKYFKIEDVIIQ